MKWDEKHMEGDTGPDGKVILKTRTQGDFRIVVTNPEGGEPKPYFMIVWVGDEHKPQLKPVVTPMKNYKASTVPGVPATAGGGSSTVSIVIAIVLGIGILLLIIKLRKRGMK